MDAHRLFRVLMDLWLRPLPNGEAALAAFRCIYTDPVHLNGVATPLASLVERARWIQGALADVEHELLVGLQDRDLTTIVFRMRGRHVGPLPTPLGIVAPSGRLIDRQIIDVLRLEEGRIRAIWVQSDELGALIQAGAVRLDATGTSISA